MTIRHQLPVHSPISCSSLLAGLGAAALGGGQRARERVKSLIEKEFEPLDLLLTDSGTSALTLALSGACERAGRRLVALPAYCCYDVATAADGADVEVVLYDIHPGTLGPDLESLRAALETKPAALVLAHLYGIPVDFDAFRPLVEQRNILVIEDAAQGHGASYKGRRLGAIGSLGVSSFGRGKGVTGGSGGALLANDEAGAAVLRAVSKRVKHPGRGTKNVIAASAQWLFGRPALYGIPASLPFLRLGETIYKPPHNPSELPITAAAGLAKNWNLARREAETRRRNADELLEVLSGFDELRTPSNPPDSVAGYLRLPALVAGRLRRVFDTRIARKLGIMPGYPTALADLGGFSDRCVNLDESFSGARSLAERLYTIPTHGKLAKGDLRLIREWVLETVRAR